MKATELMIGDWVVYNGDVDYINPIKIDGMDIATGMCVTTDRDDVGFDGVWPIPLTAEILEKNGFVYKEAEETCATDTFHLWWLDGSIFTLDDDSWWRSVKDDKLRVKFGGFPLEYVHQLQHALRLCGIEKEIIV